MQNSVAGGRPPVLRVYDNADTAYSQKHGSKVPALGVNVALVAQSKSTQPSGQNRKEKKTSALSCVASRAQEG